VDGSVDEQTVSVPFFTDRNIRTDRQANDFYHDGRGEPAWGRCAVALGEGSGSRTNATVVGVIPEDQPTILNGLAGGRVVVFVHGFNIGFEKGCRRAARLQHNLGVTGRLLLFSWPADGGYLSYLRDVTDLDWSIEDLTTVLGLLAEEFGAENVDLVGHSLGARGLVAALAVMADTPPFNTLTLAAPDMDRDLFVRALDGLGRRAERITVYVSGNDRALGLSRRAHGQPRAGQAEPGLSYPGVDLVDITSTEAREISGHIYHLHNRAVVEDLRRVLGSETATSEFERVSIGSAFALQSIAE
jgi:esterase/lipase superfamily enzyme